MKNYMATTAMGIVPTIATGDQAVFDAALAKMLADDAAVAEIEAIAAELEVEAA